MTGGQHIYKKKAYFSIWDDPKFLAAVAESQLFTKSSSFFFAFSSQCYYNRQSKSHSEKKQLMCAQHPGCLEAKSQSHVSALNRESDTYIKLLRTKPFPTRSW